MAKFEMHECWKAQTGVRMQGSSVTAAKGLDLSEAGFFEWKTSQVSGDLLRILQDEQSAKRKRCEDSTFPVDNPAMLERKTKSSPTIRMDMSHNCSAIAFPLNSSSVMSYGSLALPPIRELLDYVGSAQNRATKCQSTPLSNPDLCVVSSESVLYNLDAAPHKSSPTSDFASEHSAPKSDGAHNKYCHFCQHIKVKRSTSMLACENRGCNRRFCEHCLNLHLSQDTAPCSNPLPIPGAIRPPWHCPICTRTCCCTKTECTSNHRHCKAYRYRRKRAQLVSVPDAASAAPFGPSVSSPPTAPATPPTGFSSLHALGCGYGTGNGAAMHWPFFGGGSPTMAAGLARMQGMGPLEVGRI